MAANAAYTYAQHCSPENVEEAERNLHWHLQHVQSVDPDFVPTDSETLPCQTSFLEAVESYTEEDWQAVSDETLANQPF